MNLRRSVGKLPAKTRHLRVTDAGSRSAIRWCGPAALRPRQKKYPKTTFPPSIVFSTANDKAEFGPGFKPAKLLATW